VTTGWIGFIAARYIIRGRRDRSSPSGVFAVLGILTGVLALIVIIAVMNGFQLGFIESIVEVSSYHVRIERVDPGVNGEPVSSGDLAARIRELPLVTAAVPFRELQALVRGKRPDPQVAVIRGLPPDALEQDSGMAGKLDFVFGSFDITDPGSIILGAELALRLGLRPGDTMNLISISGSGFLDRLNANSAIGGDDAIGGDGTIGGDDTASGDDAVSGEAETADSLFRVTGIFRTGYYDYDLGWGFINTETAARLMGEDDALSLGIKLKSRWQDGRALEQIVRLPEYTALAAAGKAGTCRPWQDYNRAFYGALRTEKLMMFILVGLIFIVVGLNIFQAQRRQVLERREEIGLLRAVGASDRAVRLIFVWDGLIIGLTGATGGLILGLLIARNIAAFFTIMETVVNGFIGIVNAAAGGRTGIAGGGGEFAVFSPTVFYIKEIPSRIIPHEVALIFLFGVLSALLAAWFASRRASRTNPAEVLRDE
jgi:lipoprotein-releasing system permease protein